MFLQLFCCLYELIYQVLSHTQVKIQLGFFMCFIYGCSDEEVQLCTLFDENFCHPGSAVICIQFVEKYFVKIISCIYFQ